MATRPSEFVEKLKAEIKSKTDLRRILNAKVLRDIGEEIVDGMQEEIARGKSPIEGEGSFPSYKNPKKYPGKKKSPRPVNLSLTGKMLSDLIYQVNQAKITVTILYRTKKSQLKELGHREGANEQPKRPTIPEENEELSPSIRRRVQAVIDKAFQQAFLTWKS